MRNKFIPRKFTAIKIGKLRVRGRVLRDLLHSGGPVEIEEMDVDADIGGDAVNSRKPKRAATRPKPTRTPKVLSHVLIGALAIAGQVVAAGVAWALGFS